MSVKTRALFRLTTTAVALLISTSAVRAASSVTADFSANHVLLRASSVSQYVGATVTDSSPVASDFAIAAPPSLPHPFFRDSAIASSGPLVPTTSSEPKDKVLGQAEISFLTGTFSTNDSFTVLFTATGSAVDARNSASEPADAHQGLTAALSFFVDAFYGPLPQPPDTLVGILELPAVPSVAPGVTLTGTVAQDGLPLLSLLPGSPASTLNLYTNHSYAISFKYDLTVPFGTDPDTSFAYTASIASIPEPTAAALLLGPAALFNRRRR